ncbi:hypothetical protein SAMN05421739_11835 [Pontibacter chinhatensis]|uniref:Uncharacterized protein n=1 Tax=Pontibacter chinhatensis TaxID=1436961 RepID=A0A1I2ZT74_9BACT|nr:hypothetical protein SAMN05421739_11835 [Pontibacter chinhatensis]
MRKLLNDFMYLFTGDNKDYSTKEMLAFYTALIVIIGLFLLFSLGR